MLVAKFLLLQHANGEDNQAIVVLQSNHAQQHTACISYPEDGCVILSVPV